MEFLRLRRVPLQERVYTDDAMDVIPLVSAYLLSFMLWIYVF